MSDSKVDVVVLGNSSPQSFTVVTPNFNMGNYLATTIESVLQNLGPDDEYFIVDGGSTDSSLDVIRSYESRLSGWISEPDAGFADAVAKGFRQASKDYLCWVNSGDLLLKGALDKARSVLLQTSVDLVFGDDLLIDDDDKILQVTNGHAADLRKMMLYAGWTPLQESCFWTRASYEKVGGVDPKVKYAADYDFFLRMSLAGRCLYQPAVFGAFRRHEGQLSLAKKTFYKEEREQCRARELSGLSSNPLLPLIQAIYWFKVRWRVRMQGKKRNMHHLKNMSVHDVACQNTY